jgi:hypothetical protein
MAGVMWILSNAFLHISATILGGEYSPGVVTASLVSVPGGLCFLRGIGRARGLRPRVLPRFHLLMPL